MWRSSHSSAARRRGFTLLEAMVSLLLLVIILIVAMTMLFQMRAFAERQQYFMLPRQAARRAADYLSFYLAGASDVNYVDDKHPSPNALIMYYNLNGVATQASYNNLGCPDATGVTTCNEWGLNGARVIPANPPAIPVAIQSTNFGDIGTDIITIVAPFDPARYQAHAVFPAFGAGVNLFFNFRGGCGPGPGPWTAAMDAANELAFETATGYDGTTQSGLLMLVDRNGSWSYVRIPKNGYQSNGVGGQPIASCNDTAPGSFQNIHVNADLVNLALLPAAPNPVAGLTDPVYLVTGLQVISFRVMTDSVDGVPKLQQKLGLFDPANDNPYPPVGSPLPSFVNVMENIEDLQIAYLYARDEAAGAAGAPTSSSLVWNTSTQRIDAAAPGCAALPAPGCAGHVPFQAGPNFVAGPLPPLDISNVIGLRFSVTGRSPLLPIGARKLTNVDVKEPFATTSSQHFRPASEDHPVTRDPGNAALPLYDQYDHYRATATLMLRNRIPRG
jgi:Tfp pilus assembly protein PilV